MAHEIYTTLAGKKSMAYVGEVPWHGLGQALTAGASLDTWRKEAGLEYSLLEEPVLYLTPDNTLRAFPDRKILVRDDTLEAMSVVGSQYQTVQPREVLDFYSDLLKDSGFTMETAGSLRGGRKYWALARINKGARILDGDDITGYLLLATACDGSLATTGMFTSVRVVCANTLGFAINEGEEGKAGRRYLKVPHSTKFNAEAMKRELGLASSSWDVFMQDVAKLATCKIEREQAQEILINVFGEERPTEFTEVSEEEWEAAQAQRRHVSKVMYLFDGAALGAQLSSSQGTAWGLVNAVTEYLDHHKGERVAGSRLDSAWFGQGAAQKDRVFAECLKVAA